MIAVHRADPEDDTEDVQGARANNLARSTPKLNRSISMAEIIACGMPVAAAGTAPSGANQQPWHFVAISDPAESVGIATGILITALHTAGLATLTHTPSPMGFLNVILGRPADSERPFLLLVAGYPAPGAQVPDIARKSPGQISSWA